MITLQSLVDLHKVDAKFIVDVGGYKGEYAELVFTKYKGDCEIVIYEPINYQGVQERFKNNSNIHIVPMAVGGEVGVRSIYISEAATSFFKHWNNSEVSEKVPVCLLSTEITEKKVDILKLNCEGAEYEILDDLSRNDLIKDIGEILIQFHKVHKRDEYEEMLSKTHTKTFDFKWQLWVKK